MILLPRGVTNLVLYLKSKLSKDADVLEKSIGYFRRYLKNNKNINNKCHHKLSVTLFQKYVWHCGRGINIYYRYQDNHNYSYRSSCIKRMPSSL